MVGSVRLVHKDITRNLVWKYEHQHFIVPCDSKILRQVDRHVGISFGAEFGNSLALWAQFAKCRRAGDITEIVNISLTVAF